MANSLHRRLVAIEKKAGQGDRMVTLCLGEGKTFILTANELTRAIKAAQGTALKPVRMVQG